MARWGGGIRLAALLIGPALVAGGAARAEVAPDVVVFCDPEMVPALREIGGLFRSRTGVPVDVFAVPTRLQNPATARGVRVDLLVLQGDGAMDEAIATGLVQPATREAVAVNHLVLARHGPVRAGDPAGDLAGLLGGDTRLALVDPEIDPAGIASRAALQQAGLVPPAARVVSVVGTADAAALLTEQRVGLAITYTSDVAAIPGLAAAAALPAAGIPPITYAAATVAHPTSPNVDRFRLFLAAPEARDRLPALGLEAPR